ncbi:MAG: hypothetical protein ACLFUJ_04255 [Phycisphaerae bacterium]
MGEPRDNQPQQPKKKDKFYDAAFSIEAIQSEPYENGFTWRTVLGAFFVAFVMLPGVIFMGLMIGQDLGTAAEWVTIILFVELARRSFLVLRKQELYLLKYTVSHLSHISGGLALGGGVFSMMVWNRYLKTSEAFHNFGIAQEMPEWAAPHAEAVYSNFVNEAWWPVIAVTVGGMLLSKLTMLSLGFLAYKVTADAEKLPFPLAPVHAEGAIALAERSHDENNRGFRQYCFAIGVMCGAVFGLFYVAIPTLTTAFFNQPLQLIPIPFLDLTENFETILPAGTIGISLNLGLIFMGFVLPWRIVLGGFITAVSTQMIINPLLLYPNGILTQWRPGYDAIQTHVANSLDIYLSVGIGTALAIAVVGFYGLFKAIFKFSRTRKKEIAKALEEGEVAPGADLSALLKRDVERGDPPIWAALGVWIGSAVGFVFLSHYLINYNFETGGFLPPEEQFPVFWLILFAFVWTPVNTYINARMSGIAGQHAGIPYVKEAFIYMSGYKYVDIWFAPLPIHNFGQMADNLRICQLTRTKFTSIMKAELLIFPLMLIASFIFWNYISGLGPIPSDRYPYVQKFWPQFAQIRAVWASGMREGQSMLMQSIKPEIILGVLAATVGLFSLFGALGISAQYLYGGIASLNAYPHMAIMTFTGACIGRYVMARKFGRKEWQSYAPILMVGFGAGMGLIGMLSIAIYFLYVSVGTGY